VADYFVPVIFLCKTY